MPKPPPTSLVTTRNRSGSVLKIASASCVFSSQTPWVLVCSVQRLEAASYSAKETRASMLDTMMRLLTISTRVTCAA